MQDHAGRAFGRCAGRLWMVGWLAAAALICASPAAAQVEFHSTPDHIAIAIDGKPFTDFYIGSEYPKPFLHPLRAADGRVVTRQFPMSQVEGETRDHPHHRGLFIGYGSISGINFWENEQAYTTPNRGRIVLVGQPRVEKGQSPELNQVSSTSVSCVSCPDPQRGQVVGASRATMASLHSPQYHAGTRWPHQSWREMHQSRMLYIHS